MKKNAYKTLIIRAYHEAVTGDYPNYSINYSKIQIAAGKLQLLTNIRLRFNPLSGVATFSWNPQRAWPSLPGSDNDRVQIVCFNTERPLKVHTFNRKTRTNSEASVGLPEGVATCRYLFLDLSYFARLAG